MTHHIIIFLIARISHFHPDAVVLNDKQKSHSAQSNRVLSTFWIDHIPVIDRYKIYQNKSADHYLKREAGASNTQSLLLVWSNNQQNCFDGYFPSQQLKYVCPKGAQDTDTLRRMTFLFVVQHRHSSSRQMRYAIEKNDMGQKYKMSSSSYGVYFKSLEQQIYVL